VQLTIGGQTIIHKLGPAIGRQYGLCLLKQYMPVQFKWTNGMIKSVDWVAFLAAYQSSHHQRIFTFKFCFLLLPAGETLQKQSTRFNPKCPTYGHEFKTDHHMLQCSAVS
jgi:hypothetical protein